MVVEDECLNELIHRQIMKLNSGVLPVRYRHARGGIVVSQGMGGNYYYAFIKKSNGSLKRFNPIKGSTMITDVFRQLDQYRGKAIYRDFSIQGLNK